MLVGYTRDGDHMWSKSYAGESFDQALGLDVHGQQIYITGRFKEDLRFDDITLTSTDQYSIFVGAFLTSNGDTLWVNSVGSSGDDQGNSIEASSGGLFVGGYHVNAVNFGGIDNQPASNSSNDGFVFRYLTEAQQ